MEISWRALVTAVSPEQPGSFVLSSPGRRSPSGDAATERLGAEGTTHDPGSGQLPDVVIGASLAACRTQPLCAKGRAAAAGEAGCGHGGVLAVGCGLLRRVDSLCGALRGDEASQSAGWLAVSRVVLSLVRLKLGREPWSPQALPIALQFFGWLCRRWGRLLPALGSTAADCCRRCEGDYSAGATILGGAAYVHITASVSYFSPEREHEKWSWSLICGHSLHACVPLGDGVGVAGVTDAVVRVTPPDRLRDPVTPNGSGTGEIPYWLVNPESSVRPLWSLLWSG